MQTILTSAGCDISVLGTFDCLEDLHENFIGFFNRTFLSEAAKQHKECELHPRVMSAMKGKRDTTY